MDILEIGRLVIHNWQNDEISNYLPINWRPKYNTAK